MSAPETPKFKSSDEKADNASANAKHPSYISTVTVEGVKYVKFVAENGALFFKEKAAEASAYTTKISSQLQHIYIDDIKYVRHVAADGTHYFFAKAGILCE